MTELAGSLLLSHQLNSVSVAGPLHPGEQSFAPAISFTTVFYQPRFRSLRTYPHSNQICRTVAGRGSTALLWGSFEGQGPNPRAQSPEGLTQSRELQLMGRRLHKSGQLL